MAYWDYQQYSIGYGSYCEKDEYPDGITEKQADHLLRKRLQGFEKKLDAFLDKNNIRLSTNEYDALISFTYNNGDYWMSEKNPSRLANLLISGRYTTNEFASAFGIWCHVTTKSGTEIYDGLIEAPPARAQAVFLRRLQREKFRRLQLCDLPDGKGFAGGRCGGLRDGKLL